MWLDNFFGSKSSNFYCSHIEKLVERWDKVVKSEGEYITD